MLNQFSLFQPHFVGTCEMITIYYVYGKDNYHDQYKEIGQKNQNEDKVISRNLINDE